MDSSTTNQESKFRKKIVAFLLLVLLSFGMVLFLAGITTANALLAVLGLSFIVFSAWFVKMTGDVKKTTLYRRESTPTGE